MEIEMAREEEDEDKEKEQKGQRYTSRLTLYR